MGHFDDVDLNAARREKEEAAAEKRKRELEWEAEWKEYERGARELVDAFIKRAREATREGLMEQHKTGFLGGFRYWILWKSDVEGCRPNLYLISNDGRYFVARYSEIENREELDLSKLLCKENYYLPTLEVREKRRSNFNREERLSGLKNALTRALKGEL